MSKIMKQAQHKSHIRNIEISIYSTHDENKFIVEGFLKDDRLNDYYLITGEKRHGGKIHNMAVRMLVSVPHMKIEDIEAEMIDVPGEECHDTTDFVKSVIGLTLTQGYSIKVRSLLGGINGCTHMVNLLINMAPAAIQGIWSFKAQKKVDIDSGQNEKKRVFMMEDFLKNTCYAWREKGKRFQKLKGAIEKLR